MLAKLPPPHQLACGYGECACVCVRLNFAFANLTSRQYRRFPCACFLYCCCCCFHSRYHPEGEDLCGILTKSVDAVTLVPTNILKQHHFHSILLNFLLPQRKNRTQIDEINPKELSYSDSISSQSWEIEMNGTVPFFSLSLMILHIQNVMKFRFILSKFNQIRNVLHEMYNNSTHITQRYENISQISHYWS